MGQNFIKTDKKVVIVGGSFAGFNVASQLWDYADVTIIDQKDYFEYLLTIPKCFVRDNKPENLMVPFETCSKYTGDRFKFI